MMAFLRPHRRGATHLKFTIVRMRAEANDAEFAIVRRHGDAFNGTERELSNREQCAKSNEHVYDESKIKTLSSLEHIRLRTGMYIGRIGDGSHYDDGCYILLKEVVDNAIDEYIMGHGREIHVSIEGTTVSVRDFGRGIP